MQVYIKHGKTEHIKITLKWCRFDFIFWRNSYIVLTTGFIRDRGNRPPNCRKQVSPSPILQVKHSQICQGKKGKTEGVSTFYKNEHVCPAFRDRSNHWIHTEPSKQTRVHPSPNRGKKQGAGERKGVRYRAGLVGDVLLGEADPVLDAGPVRVSVGVYFRLGEGSFHFLCIKNSFFYFLSGTNRCFC
jgi:hypothetical protein